MRGDDVMQTKIRRVAAAAAIVGALGVGGATLAFAQEAPTSTTPPAQGDAQECDYAGKGSGSSSGTELNEPAPADV
jgi:hypothetical protein